MKLFYSKNWLFFLFVCFAFLIKCYLLFQIHNNNISDEIAYNNGDAGHYLKIAKNIHDFHVYSDNNSIISTENATWRPPFWPFLLSLFFIFTSNIFYLLLIKVVLEFIIVLGCLFLFKRKSELKTVHFLPFFLILIEPYYLKYSTTFLSESITSVLIFILTIVFINLNLKKRYTVFVPIVSGLILLCHPVSAFFVLSMVTIYLLINVRHNFKIAVLHGLLFCLIITSWTYRNYITFNQGFYLTASQGATFSKGWNEKVCSQFTNVDGDLADESINLKYVNKKITATTTISVLELSHLYREGTLNYIKTLSLKETGQIALKKLKSNFNPFPEKPKSGILETAEIFFRIVYLILFVQLLFRIFNKEKINFENQRDRVFMVVFSVLLGQIVMSIYVYTGFRFNAVYSLVLLFCFLYINTNWLYFQKSKIKMLRNK